MDMTLDRVMTFGRRIRGMKRKEKKIWIIRHGTLEFGSDLIFPMIRPDKQMSTRKEQHVYATVLRAVDSHKLPCWLSIIKNTWSCRSLLSSSPFPSTNIPARVFPDSHELNLRILSLILIALELHDLIGRGRRDRWIFFFMYLWM